MVETLAGKERLAERQSAERKNLLISINYGNQHSCQWSAKKFVAGP
jgi:hypothetical protein